MIFLKPYYFYLLTAMLFCSSSYEQNIPDSLLHKLNNTQNDSIKARTMLDIGEAIEAASPEKSLAYYQQALGLSKQIKNNRLILSSTVDVGIAYIESNDMDKALAIFLEAIPIAKMVNDTGKTAGVLGDIGNVYLHKNDPVHATNYYLQAAELLERSSDQSRLPILYSNLCSLLNDQKEFGKAIEYGNKAIELAKKNDDNYTLVNALINLSNTYSYLKQPQKEYSLLQKALPLAIKNKDLEQLSDVYNNIGDYYYEQKKYQPSLNYYLESYKYTQQMGNHYHICTACSHLALLYHNLNQPNKAMHFILQAETLAKEVGTRANMKEIYLTRAEIEKQRGNFKIAYDYLYKSSEIKDSLFKVETSEKVADIEARYENEKKQKEILQLEKDKQIQNLSIRQKSTLNYFLFGSIAALLIVGFSGYRNLRHRQQLAKQQEELHQQQIRELEKDKQLVAVDSMLKGQEDERSRLAKDLHDGLGGLLSGVKFSLSNMKDNLIITPDNMTVFERSLDMIDTSIKELRRVAHNMMPEMLVKFGLDEGLKEYCISINTTKLLIVKYQSLGMEERIDKSIEIIIYRIVQELLNNIIKHAAATDAFVQLIREGARLNVVVEDNGKGFETNLTDNKGAGLENVRSRVDYLKGQLDIHSEIGKGTLVNIEFNI